MFGSEMDLVLEFPGGTLWAIEIKLSSIPKLERGFHEARVDLKPQKTFVVHGGTDRYPLADGVEVISLRALAVELAALAAPSVSSP
jgi:uncharacterized protein